MTRRRESDTEIHDAERSEQNEVTQHDTTNEGVRERGHRGSATQIHSMEEL